MARYEYQLKFVIEKREDVEEARSLAESLGASPERVILMPEGVDRDSLRERGVWLAEICKEEGFRFSPRLHVELWGLTARRVEGALLLCGAGFVGQALPPATARSAALFIGFGGRSPAIQTDDKNRSSVPPLNKHPGTRSVLLRISKRISKPRECSHAPRFRIRP